VVAGGSNGADEVELLELRARVGRLEALLARRSRELRALHSLMSTDALERALAAYVPPSPSMAQLDSWQESHTMRPAEIEEAMAALWQAAERDRDDA
jgi:hypothetical protein